jgi:hypothetical protein
VCRATGFEVLTTLAMESSIFWDITPCSTEKVNGRIRGTYRKVPASHWFLLGLLLDTADGGDTFHRKVP